MPTYTRTHTHTHTHTHTYARKHVITHNDTKYQQYRKNIHKMFLIPSIKTKRKKKKKEKKKH